MENQFQPQMNQTPWNVISQLTQLIFLKDTQIFSKKSSSKIQWFFFFFFETGISVIGMYALDHRSLGFGETMRNLSPSFWLFLSGRRLLTVSTKLGLQLIFFSSKIPWRYSLCPVNYRPTLWHQHSLQWFSRQQFSPLLIMLITQEM